jgi:hypothetical protein
MPRNGRPPKPTELKRLLGNPGKRPLPATMTVIAPVSVADMAASGPTSGDELTDALLAAGAMAWIGQTDRLGLLAMLRDAWDERRELRRALFDLPPDDLDPKAARLWATTARKDLRELEKQITTWLSLLGLTPTDRSRLGVAEVKARSTLEKLADRRQLRAAGGPRQS